MEREDRTMGLYLFQNGNKRALISTSIGENGICYKNIDMVVNFDFPKNAASSLKRAQKVTKKEGIGKLRA